MRLSYYSTNSFILQLYLGKSNTYDYQSRQANIKPKNKYQRQPKLVEHKLMAKSILYQF
jgi:hypothetical protein